MSGASLLTALSAAIFVLTPLLWQLADSNPAALLPLLPVLAWLWATSKWTQTRSAAWGVAAGAALGLGLHTSLAAVVMMPAYLAITLAILAHGRVASWRHYGSFVAAFLAGAAPLAATWLRHPEQLRLAINSHHLYDADRFSLLQGAREVTSWVGLTARSEVYWDYFNPAFLFLIGGVLLPPVIVLLPCGLLALAREPATPLSRLWLAGLAVAPLAAALTAEAPIPARALYLTPFAAVIAARGAQYLLALTGARR